MGLTPKARQKLINQYAAGLDEALYFYEIGQYGMIDATRHRRRRIIEDTDGTAHFTPSAILKLQNRLRELGLAVPAPPDALEGNLPLSEPEDGRVKHSKTRAKSRFKNMDHSTGTGRHASTHEAAPNGGNSQKLATGNNASVGTPIPAESRWAAAVRLGPFMMLVGIVAVAIGVNWLVQFPREQSNGIELSAPTPAIADEAVLNYEEPVGAQANEPPLRSHEPIPGVDPPIETWVDEPVIREEEEPAGPVQADSQPPDVHHHAQTRHDPSHLRLVPADGTTIHAVRFEATDWIAFQQDGLVPLPGAGAERPLDGRATHPIEVLVEYASGQMVVMRGDIVDGPSASLVLDHPAARFALSDGPSDDSTLTVRMDARSQVNIATGYRASINGEAPLRLPAVLPLPEGTHELRISHPTPGRIDDRTVMLRNDGAGLHINSDAVLEVKLHEKRTLTVLNLTEEAVRIQGTAFHSSFVQMLVPLGDTASVSTSAGGAQWTGPVDTDTVLLVATARPNVGGLSTTLSRRDAERAAESACEGTLEAAFAQLGTRVEYPTGLFGGKTGVQAAFDLDSGKLIRKAPANLRVWVRSIAVEYECHYEAVTNRTSMVHIAGQELSHVVLGILPEVIAAPADSESHGATAAVPSAVASHEEPRHLQVAVRSQIPESEFLVLAESGRTGELGPISLVPIGPDSARTQIREMTLVIPVVEFATTRFVATDAHAQVTVVTDDQTQVVGIGTVEVRTPVGSEMTVLARSDDSSRFRPIEQHEVQSSHDRTVTLVQQRSVTVAFDSEVQGATLRIPGVVDTPVELPVSLELVADQDYRVIVEPPDERWYESSSSLRFSEDTSVTPSFTAAAQLTFTSDPPGATIRVQGMPRATTPATYRFPVGSVVTYQINANPPNHKSFSGQVNVTGDAVHPTYLERYSDAERQEFTREQAAAADVDAWFTHLIEVDTFIPVDCPVWAEEARACAAVVHTLGRASSALGVRPLPGFRAVGEGSLWTVQDPDNCQGWDKSVWRAGCRLMYEYVGPGSVVLVLDREYLLLYLNDAPIEAALVAAKAARDASFAAEEAGRQATIDAQRRENVGGLDTMGKVREMTRDLFSRLNYGSRSCDGLATQTRFALCGQTHGDIEVFTQFTETHLLRSAYFDGQILGPWRSEGKTARLPLLIDGRTVTVTFVGEQGPFKNFGTILIELHD